MDGGQVLNIVEGAMPSGPDQPDHADQRDSFETTQWSIVLAAGGHEHGSAQANAALEVLCRRYWSPLFAFARRRGHPVADAQDLVQGFFARILERRDLAAVRQEKGRFRSYLLTAFKNYLANEREHAGAAKRGGGQVPIPLDVLINANHHGPVPVDQHSPDRAFDQQWAHALLHQVLTRLGDEYRSDGRERQFTCLQCFLTEANHARSQAEIASELGMGEGAVKQAVFRLRQRYQKLLRSEVAQTVATLGDVDAELRHLIAALRA